MKKITYNRFDLMVVQCCKDGKTYKHAKTNVETISRFKPIWTKSYKDYNDIYMLKLNLTCSSYSKETKQQFKWMHLNLYDDIYTKYDVPNLKLNLNTYFLKWSNAKVCQNRKQNYSKDTN